MEKYPNFTELLTIYKKTLLEDIVPFWMKHGIDHDYGGIFNCIKEVKQLSFLLAVTINVGLGFAYGYMKR